MTGIHNREVVIGYTSSDTLYFVIILVLVVHKIIELESGREKNSKRLNDNTMRGWVGEGKG